MGKTFDDLLMGYASFRERYVDTHPNKMEQLSRDGQSPQVMVIACSDSRVDPALLLQCDPGDLFVVRSVASIVPPHEDRADYPGTSAALEFAVRFLKVKHIVLLGHSQCGGMQALADESLAAQTHFIAKWVSTVSKDAVREPSVDNYAKEALRQSELNCMRYPWLKERVDSGRLQLHRWFFEIKTGKILAYTESQKAYMELEAQLAVTV